MIDKREVAESIDSYLGEREKEVLKTLTPSILKSFMQLRIKLNTSYYVYGTRTLLAQFKAFYLASCLKEVARPKYGMQMITDRAQMLFEDSPEDLGADEVLFLYAHSNNVSTGKSEEWLARTIINDVANRNRKGYTTIILTERELPEIKRCGELIPVSLSSSKKSIKRIVDEISTADVNDDGSKYR